MLLAEHPRLRIVRVGIPTPGRAELQARQRRACRKAKAPARTVPWEAGGEVTPRSPPMPATTMLGEAAYCLEEAHGKEPERRSHTARGPGCGHLSSGSTLAVLHKNHCPSQWP